MQNSNPNKVPYTRKFDIEAISVPIVYNYFGDNDPNGMMYALKDDVSSIQADANEKFQLSPPQPSSKVVPLVLRCNKGDIIQVNFHNSISDTITSIHIQGVNYNVLTSDGASVGYNPDTTTSDTITYTWFADTEGTYLFSDLADPRSGEFTNIHGLFGCLIVEKEEAAWYDPTNGTILKSGLFADIYHPHHKSFREYTVFFQDELAVKDKNGKPPMDPHTLGVSSTMGISYRSEPMRNRELPEHLRQTHDHTLEGEDVSMSSWTYGDPATFLLNAYVGDPSTMRLINAGVKETHVMHVHNHQWRLEPENPDSTIIDSQSISPQECYNLEFLYGAGSLTGTIGDVIFHCHLYPHFMEGMWGLWRIFDRLQDGTNKLPDGTIIPTLLPLKDRRIPPKTTPKNPGYPNFINGTYGDRPLQPPLGIKNPDGTVKTIPTQLEEDNFIKGATPGALYSKTCPSSPPCKPDKTFEIALVQAKLEYNHYKWHDPQGRFFVLREDIEAHGGVMNYIQLVENGTIKVEPLVIRANAGDCIEVRLTNLLPLFLEESAFELRTLTNIVGFHIHLVKFDTITSDGSANGWCNIDGAFQFETLIERFYADEELNTIFLHDHLFANSHQQHGVFGALIIEPKCASFHDIRTGAPLKNGTQAIIRRSDGTAFREFTLMVHDFAYLFEKDGTPLNAPIVAGSHDDPGVMGINYRCEPMRERLKKPNTDPANLFSSHEHGDPATPILETYAGDEMVIHLLQGAHEEQHCFNINGMQWRKEPNDPNSPLTSSQTLGISEAFNLHINKEYGHGDYLYYFGGIDDVWLGLWGIIRAYSKPNRNLLPLQHHYDTLRPIVNPPRKAKIRHYKIVAMKTDIQYNHYEDHDPDGLIFAPLKDYKKILQKKMNPKPLILRANKGDVIRVTLYNKISESDPIQYFDYPSVPVDKPHTPSNRISIVPQLLQYDNLKYSGVNVGYNYIEQTVAPGKYKTYEWFADESYGTCTLNSFADLRNHRGHGLFGTIIIEPEGSHWYSNNTLSNPDHDEQVVVTPPNETPFFENVIFIQNGIRLLDKHGTLIKTAEGIAPGDDTDVDHEDTGEKGYNYRSERFYNRLHHDTHPHLVFSSKVHSDPSTPIFTASTGNRVIFRTLMPSDKPRNVSFAIHGHMWKEHPDDSASRIIPIQGHISVNDVYNIELIEGASLPGDYLYRSGSLRWDVESGMWGIFRVSNQPIDCKTKHGRHKFICRARSWYRYFHKQT